VSHFYQIFQNPKLKVQIILENEIPCWPSIHVITLNIIPTYTIIIIIIFIEIQYFWSQSTEERCNDRAGRGKRTQQSTRKFCLLYLKRLFIPSVRPSVFVWRKKKRSCHSMMRRKKSCGREKNQGRGTMTRHKTLKTLDDIPHTTPNKVGDIEEDGPGCCWDCQGLLEMGRHCVRRLISPTTTRGSVYYTPPMCHNGTRSDDKKGLEPRDRRPSYRTDKVPPN
jgi:hypothetical protein